MDTWRRHVDEEEPQHTLNCTSAMLDEIEKVRSIPVTLQATFLPKDWRQKTFSMFLSARLNYGQSLPVPTSSLNTFS